MWVSSGSDPQLLETTKNLFCSETKDSCRVTQSPDSAVTGQDRPRTQQPGALATAELQLGGSPACPSARGDEEASEIKADLQRGCWLGSGSTFNPPTQ